MRAQQFGDLGFGRVPDRCCASSVRARVNRAAAFAGSVCFGLFGDAQRRVTVAGCEVQARQRHLRGRRAGLRLRTSL